MQTINIGSRKSDLAMWQARTVARHLQNFGFKTKIRQIETRGDRNQQAPIAAIGGRGVFTDEIEKQLLNGEIQIAVHSAKDMPSQIDDAFSLIAFTKREKPNDILLSPNSSLSLENREKRIVIGTSSVRRVAMLRHHYPHIETVEMRGNLQTRIRKLEAGQCDALMLAYAGVKRMAYDHMIAHSFPEEQFTPAAGQGALAIEAAASMDTSLKKELRACLNHEETERLLLAERAYLKELQGGCSIPVFGLARATENSTLTLTGGLISLDGREVLRRTETADMGDATRLGQSVGRYILENNGRELLDAIRKEQFC